MKVKNKSEKVPIGLIENIKSNNVLRAIST